MRFADPYTIAFSLTYLLTLSFKASFYHSTPDRWYLPCLLYGIFPLFSLNCAFQSRTILSDCPIINPANSAASVSDFPTVSLRWYCKNTSNAYLSSLDNCYPLITVSLIYSFPDFVMACSLLKFSLKCDWACENRAYLHTKYSLIIEL